MKKYVAPPDFVRKSTIKWVFSMYPEQGREIMQSTYEGYRELLKKAPEYGGRNIPHNASIYGGIWVFALRDGIVKVTGEMPDRDEFQLFTRSTFMSAFEKIGKIMDLRRHRDMKIIDSVFKRVSVQDKKHEQSFDTCFITRRGKPVRDDEGNIRASRYKFIQCPVAEFAKANRYMDTLPFLCNCDYYGIEQIGGVLIRKGTCGTSDECDYLVVGADDPAAARYDKIYDSTGTIVSVLKDDNYDMEQETIK